MRAVIRTTQLALAAAALLAVPLGVFANPRPLRAPIAIDGDLTDWAEVLANPRNTTWDGQGAGLLNCANSTDSDCAIPSLGLDLEVFAWTWDDSALYVMIGTHAVAGTSHYFLFLDADFDGLLEKFEPVVYLSGRIGGVSNDLAVDTYEPASPAGDPLVEGAGKADGYTVPGEDRGAEVAVTSDLGDALGIPRWEGRIPWNVLGVVPGAPMAFHLSVAPGRNIPGITRDNLGGPDDGVGLMAWRDLTLAPPLARSVAPGGTVRLAHDITNTGNLDGRIHLFATSSAGWDLAFWSDADGDGLEDIWLGTDAGGDGLFTLPGDALSPAGDSDGDQRLDLGVLPRDGRARVVIIPVVPLAADGVIDVITVTAQHQAEVSVAATLLDEVRVGNVTLRPDVTRLCVAGDFAWFPHVVQNNTPDSVVVDLDAVSAWGWATSLESDPNDDGDPADAVPLADSDASGLPDVRLTGGGSVSVFVRAQVPAAQPLGRVDVTLARGIVAGAPVATVTDRATVTSRLTLEPNYRLSDGDARYGAAGGGVYLAHRLGHAGGASDVYAISAVSDLGWPLTLLSDPDGDGRPYDSEILPWSSGLVSGGGGTFNFLLRVDVPAGTAAGQVSRINLTATSAAQPAVSRSVEDDAVVAIVRVTEDAGHLVNLRQAAPCSIVHAKASNLVPSNPNYRFAWRDPSGLSLRLTTVTTDVFGGCADTLVLFPGLAGDGFEVVLEQWSGAAWNRLDAAVFEVGDDLAVTDLAPLAPEVHVAGRTFEASATLTNESFDQSLSSLALRWVVRTADGALYLAPGGTFLPYTGMQATRIATVSLAPGASTVLRLIVPSVTFPSFGPYEVEIHRFAACAGDSFLASAKVEVIDDEDGDSLSRTLELAAGTDPTDADSDDDGLLDGEDGLGDTDADGVVDALDCDSDDDGLPDGLESGVWSPWPATDVARGCFTPDLWPATTTDPDSTDTDGGGVPDGVEDRDHDGKVDVGEGDPNAAADDALLDTDGDTLGDLTELDRGLSPLDRDSDDDGLPDGAEPNVDTDGDGDGLGDGLDCDSDNDGLPDGLESGVVVPGPDVDLSAGCFVADADPSTTTNPRRADTDRGGAPDGFEDRDGDGLIDAGEGDPNDPADDLACAPGAPLEVQDLRVACEGAGLRLSWRSAADPCARYVVLRGTDASRLDPWGTVGFAASRVEPTWPPGAVYYVVRAISAMGDTGP